MSALEALIFAYAIFSTEILFGRKADVNVVNIQLWD